MVAAQRGVDVDKARGPVKLALKKMVASNLVKQLKVSFLRFALLIGHFFMSNQKSTVDMFFKLYYRVLVLLVHSV